MDARSRLLVVDDDASVRSMLREYLEGHEFAVVEAATGAQMREHIEHELPDVVLLDIRLPGEDGLVLARYLREHYDVGIIMVTASGDLVDRVVGLELGADDYIAKPFDLRELLARVKSVLRRLQAKPSREGTPQAARDRNNNRSNSSSRGASGSGAAKSISSRAACSRSAAARSRSRRWNTTCSRHSWPIPTGCCRATSSFCARVTANGSRSTARSTSASAGLRRKIEPDPSGEPRCIRTVRNAGYMFIPNTS